jgi:NDP-sugar pyrophosphorylase family protein
LEHPLLVMNGDLVTRFDVTRMLAHHRELEAAATVAVRHHQVDIPFGVVEAGGGRLRALSEKPSVDFLINAGIYVLEPALLDLIAPQRFFPMTGLLDRLLADGRTVAVYQVEEDWIDVGRREDLSRANGV